MNTRKAGRITAITNAAVIASAAAAFLGSVYLFALVLEKLL